MFLLYTTEHAGTNQATAAGFLVSSFDDVVAELRRRSVTFEEIDFGGGMATVDGVLSTPDGSEKSCWFEDSEGNILSVGTAPDRDALEGVVGGDADGGISHL